MTYIRRPEWLKIDFRSDNRFTEVSKTLHSHHLNTICSSGRCPNMAECWSRGTATFMILGNRCTRNCRFCNTETGHPLPPLADEPQQLARSIAQMGLKHAVITSVTRDDLPDQGAAHWAACIRAVRQVNPNVTVEILVPDFGGKAELIDQVAETHPDIMAHNIETVRRLTPIVRSVATYDKSLQTLQHIAAHGLPTKSGLMLGLGETEDEIFQTMDDLLHVGCRRLTLGQYLQPSRRHYPVQAYIHPDKFIEYREVALEKGFHVAVSGPLVRSSYHADLFVDVTK